jgi:integrase
VAKNVASHITMYNTADRIILSVAYDLPELAQIYLAAGDLEENERDAIRLICLTGCRRNEVIGARLSDFKGEVWIIPPSEYTTKGGQTYPISHSKNGKPHHLKLAPLGKAILDSRAAKTFAFCERPHRYSLRECLPNLRSALESRGYELQATNDIFRAIRRGFRSALSSDAMYQAGYHWSDDDKELAMNHVKGVLHRTYDKSKQTAKIAAILMSYEVILRAAITAIEPDFFRSIVEVRFD